MPAMIGGAEPHQAQAGAVAIAGIGRLRRAKRQDGALAIAELLADFAQREPGRRKARREVRRLHKQILGGDEIAAQLQVAGKVEAPVGEHVARRHEQARWHVVEPIDRRGIRRERATREPPAQDRTTNGPRQDMASALVAEPAHRGLRQQSADAINAARLIYLTMRPQDILMPVPAGLCCKPGGFHIDPVRPVERAVITHGHSDHARPGHGAVLATQETLDMMRLRYGDNFAGSTQADRLWRGTEARRRHDQVSSRRPCAGLGADRGLLQGHLHRRVRRLQGRARSDLRAVRSGAVRRLHHRGHLRPAGVSPRRCGRTRSKKLLASVALFPERAHLVGAYSLGKAQRVIALLRLAGYDAPIYLHGAMEKITRYYESRGIALGDLRPVKGMKKADLAGTITLAPPSATSDIWTRRFPDPVTAFASGWMRVRARARQRGVELPLVISDHADWDGLTATIDATGAGEIWVTHGQEDALVHWCKTKGLAARPLDLVGYGDEDESERAQRPRAPRHEPLRRTARSPRLRARPQQQAAADHGYFREVGRSRSRLRAGGADRRAVVQARQTRTDPRPDRRSHRSGAVRAVV